MTTPKTANRLLSDEEIKANVTKRLAEKKCKINDDKRREMLLTQKWGQLIAKAENPLAGIEVANNAIARHTSDQDRQSVMIKHVITIALKLNPAIADKGVKGVR